MAAQINPKSHGRFILNNHILLESIITELPELSDIISLSCVSNQINYHIRHIFPLEVRKLSLTTIPAATDTQLLAIFNRHLQDQKGFKQRKSILDGGGTITVGGGGPLGAPYSGSFRNLSDVDLSGTLVSTFAVKVLIAATAGGKVPGLTVLPSQAFYKDFVRVVPLTPEEEARHRHDLRLLEEQGLRLTRLSVKNCRNVDISRLIYFLRRVLAAATQEAKIQRNQATTNNNNGNNAGGGNHHIPEPLQHLGLLEEDITATPGPLPGTVEELAEYGLPCFSLRILEVAGVDGLQFSKKDEIFKNLASLNMIAGCLGLEIDVKFCQGAGCALGVLEDPDSSDYCVGDGEHHRDSYKRPLPYLPGERFLVDPASGRIFRIPKHCLPQVAGTQQQQQQQQQPPPQPPQPPQNQPPPPPPPGITLTPPANPPQPNTQGFSQHIIHIMQQHHHQHHHQLQQNHQYQVALQQNQQYHHLMNQVPPPAAPPIPPAAIIPQQPGIAMMRRVRMEPDSSERQGRQFRRVAMLNGPRGLCEGCGRELWLCETCNTFWVLYCGGCAARNPSGAREHQQRRDEDDVAVV